MMSWKKCVGSSSCIYQSQPFYHTGLSLLIRFSILCLWVLFVCVFLLLLFVVVIAFVYSRFGSALWKWPTCFLMREREGVELDGWWGREKLWEVGGRETIIRTYCLKIIYFQEIKRVLFIETTTTVWSLTTNFQNTSFILMCLDNRYWPLEPISTCHGL